MSLSNTATLILNKITQHFLSEEFISVFSPILHLSPPILLRVGLTQGWFTEGKVWRDRKQRWQLGPRKQARDGALKRELHNDRDGWRQEKAIKRFRDRGRKVRGRVTRRVWVRKDKLKRAEDKENKEKKLQQPVIRVRARQLKLPCEPVRPLCFSFFHPYT